jgi:poly(glycerol-phosphate) alpha-glucosyltransferase
MGVLEAWSYGKPTLITPQCNLSEGLRAGASLEAEPTFVGLTDQLQKLIDLTSAERSEMGRRARDLVRRSFSSKHCAMQMNEVYEWLAHSNEAPKGTAFPDPH